MGKIQSLQKRFMDFYYQVPHSPDFEYLRSESFHGWYEKSCNNFHLNSLFQCRPGKATLKEELTENISRLKKENYNFSLSLLEETANEVEGFLMKESFKKSEKEGAALYIEATENYSADTNVEKVQRETKKDFFDVFCQAFQLDESLAEKFDAAFYSHPHVNNDNYLYKDSDSGKYIAMANLSQIDPCPKIGLLGGACVLEEYRNQGIYQALLQHRLQKAFSNNLEYVFLLSTVSTSYKPALKFGFAELGLRYINYEYNHR